MKYSILQNRLREGDGENQRSIFRRINIFDIFFVLIILAIILLISTFFFDFSIFGIGSEEVEIAYTVERDNVSSDMVGRIEKGDLVLDPAGKENAGFVTNISYSDCVRYMYNEESGAIEKVTLPEDETGYVPQTVKITIQVNADYDKGAGYSVNGTRIVVGSSLDLCFAEFTGVGECIELTVLDTKGGN